MAQTATYTLVNAKSTSATYDMATNQANVVARTVYISGTLTGTVKIEASPVDSGDEWVEVMSVTTVGVKSFTIDPVCKRLRGKLADMVAGPVTVKVCCRYEQ
jgi:hypothetical protein